MKKKIIGIDPGTIVTGYGVIEVQGNAISLVDYGCIRPPPSRKLTDRYLIIFESVEELISRHAPDCLVVETQYVHKNVQSALKLGMARGIAIVAGKRKGAKVVEYAPSKVKRAVTGKGSASKQQVQGMVKALLSMPHLPEPEDAADALALAICHAQARRWQLKEEEI